MTSRGLSLSRHSQFGDMLLVLPLLRSFQLNSPKQQIPQTSCLSRDPKLGSSRLAVAYPETAIKLKSDVALLTCMCCPPRRNPASLLYPRASRGLHEEGCLG